MNNNGDVNNQPVNNPVPTTQTPQVVNNTMTTNQVSQPVNNTVPANQPLPAANNNVSTNPVTPTVNNSVPVNPVTPPPVNNDVSNDEDDDVEYEYVEQKKSHKGILFILLLLLIIGGMGYYIYTDHQKDLRNKCSPLVTKTNQKNNLKLDSTIVQDLYQKVKTDINEDIANSEFDDKMKLYLAYRQIPNYEIYNSNCNLFNNSSMPNLTCDSDSGFVTTAFKEETLMREVKKLFGEDTNLSNDNIQLGVTCVGGYQYIAERGEYVMGQCNNTTNAIYQVDKKLISAYAYNDTVVLKEKVRYYGEKDVNIDRLKNGVYVYTFKLDNNYNYTFVSKEIE